MICVVDRSVFVPQAMSREVCNSAAAIICAVVRMNDNPPQPPLFLSPGSRAAIFAVGNCDASPYCIVTLPYSNAAVF